MFTRYFFLFKNKTFAIFSKFRQIFFSLPSSILILYIYIGAQNNRLKFVEDINGNGSYPSLGLKWILFKRENRRLFYFNSCKQYS